MTGLNQNDDELPDIQKPRRDMEPIDLLRPNTDHHGYVLNYLLDRIKASESKMTTFYPRWQVAERKFQAYLNLPKYEQMLREMNDKSKVPAPALILFPYKYAVISTIVTYGMKVFFGKKPFFPLGADSKEAADNQRYMEAMVQRHCDMNRMILRGYQALLDGELYGVAAVRCMWKERTGKRRKIRQLTEAERFMHAADPASMPRYVRDYETKVIFAGSDLLNIDPFMFFPDPNVPMQEVSEKGEFIFWREFIPRHSLLMAQNEGLVKYIDTLQPGDRGMDDGKWYNLSNRSALTGGDSHAGERQGGRGRGEQYSNSHMVDQGTIWIIPSELGLGESENPELWLFSIVNKSQIIQAEPLDYDHGRHPVEVSEPYSMGYGFGQPALGDYIGPLQDIMSWFIDSHIFNVRTALNNQWLYDPSKVDEASLKYPQPGKHIKLKPLAYGTDVRTVLTQFPVSDATRGHMQDMSQFLRIGDMVSSVNDPMRGVQQAGGRRTAAEVRQVGENAFGRLGVHQQLISQMLFCRLAEQMVLNIQQFQEEAQWVEVIGRNAFERVGMNLLTGDFTYPVHDGTLPVDKVASFQLWKEVLMGVAQDPLLRRTHSLPRMFEHVASLGGMLNVSSFRLVSDAEMDQLVQAGNAAPVPQAAPRLRPQ